MNPSDEGDDSALRCYPSWRQSLLNKLLPRLWHCVEGANADLPAWISVSALDQVRSLVACCVLPRGRSFLPGEDGDLLPLPVGNGARAAGVSPCTSRYSAQPAGQQKHCGWGGERRRRGDSHTQINLLQLWTWTFLMLIWVCNSRTDTQSV